MIIWLRRKRGTDTKYGWMLRVFLFNVSDTQGIALNK